MIKLCIRSSYSYYRFHINVANNEFYDATEMDIYHEEDELCLRTRLNVCAQELRAMQEVLSCVSLEELVRMTFGVD